MDGFLNIVKTKNRFLFFKTPILVHFGEKLKFIYKFIKGLPV